MLIDSTVPVAALRWGSRGSDSEEVERFQQARIALYARFMGTLMLGLYLTGAIVILIVAPKQWLLVHGHPSKLVNLGLALALLGSWAFLRGPRRRASLLRAFDVGMPLLLAVGICVSLAYAPRGYHFEFAGLLVLVLTLVLRAALVPSTAAWTAQVGLFSSPPLLLGAYFQLAPGNIGFVTPPLIIAGLGVWCVASTAVTAMVSRVIYGLVTQVRNALRLGQYTLRDKIGEGGMGAVYRAEHALLRRPTAVKLLLPDRAGAESVTRFEREVQLTSQLSHPNTVQIYDYGHTPDGVFFYAMEYLDGRTLERLVEEEGPQPAGRVVHILRQVAGSLREAHGVRLIHRDIKPSNILLGTRGGIPEFVKVIDFGLVKHIDPGIDVAVTHMGAITGTPLFIAPECITQPEAVDDRSDSYSLGGVGYFLATGAPPFAGKNAIEVLGQHMHTLPTSPSERLGRPLPALLEALLLRCLAKDPKARPSDVELRVLLDACAEEAPWVAEDRESSASS